MADTPVWDGGSTESELDYGSEGVGMVEEDDAFSIPTGLPLPAAPPDFTGSGLVYDELLRTKSESVEPGHFSSVVLAGESLRVDEVAEFQELLMSSEDTLETTLDSGDLAVLGKMWETGCTVSVPESLYYVPLDTDSGTISPPASKLNFDNSYNAFNTSGSTLRHKIVVALLETKENLSHAECRRYIVAKKALHPKHYTKIRSTFQNQLERSFKKKSMNKRNAMSVSLVKAKRNDTSSLSMTQSFEPEVNISRADLGTTVTDDFPLHQMPGLPAIPPGQNYRLYAFVLCAAYAQDFKQQRMKDGEFEAPYASMRAHMSYGDQCFKTHKVAWRHGLFAWYQSIGFTVEPNEPAVYFELVGRGKTGKEHVGVACFDLSRLKVESAYKSWLPVRKGDAVEVVLKVAFKLTAEADPEC